MEYNSAATTAIIRNRQTPLASCEARARRAFEKGQISGDVYQRLIGITAEAAEESGNRVGNGGGDSSGGGSGSSKLSSTNKGNDLTSCGTPVPRLPPREDDLTVLLSESSPYAGVDPDLSQLERMREQGFGLAVRAERFWSSSKGKSKEGDHTNNGPTNENSEDNDDERLLQFMDVCLKAYPPNNCPRMEEEAPDHDDDSDDGEGHSISEGDNEPSDIIAMLTTINGAVASGAQRQQQEVPLEYKPLHSDIELEHDDTEIRRWESRFGYLRRFKATHGHADVPIREGSLNGPMKQSLGYWAATQRSLYDKRMLSKQRFERLNKLGFPWEETSNTSSGASTSFCGVDLIPSSIKNTPVIQYKSKDNVTSFCGVELKLSDKHIPNHYNDSTAARSARMRFLANDPSKELAVMEARRWEFKFQSLLRFKATHGHCNVPVREGGQNGPLRKSLGHWCETQREFNANGDITKFRYQRLNEIGFPWVARTAAAPAVTTSTPSSAAIAADEMDDAVGEILSVLDFQKDAHNSGTYAHGMRVPKAHQHRDPNDSNDIIREWLEGPATKSANSDQKKKTLVKNPTHIPLKINGVQTPSYKIMEGLFSEKIQAMNQATMRSASDFPRIGRWSTPEHLLYLEGLRKFGPGKSMLFTKLMTTRTALQVRSHEQKYMKLLARARDKGEEFAYCCGVQVHPGILAPSEAPKRPG
mmetsp:Transcript_8956/g.16135  ORF Transcript_8956/g.16135 Transcript_8956/m.16135 type:complete len:700 (-) Transcript_8956:1787-3886(-)|eukprot:CAMPEP_0201660910 /NCGR_PEP_ID=MMETSP0494-20130426/3423_1 /ASSEMBLY_ACC=CAM_ASM_000839 /TAXON_ID=420259 /ORGANISM="Thalassiosira gravida, Strain GMp14c1" /LENGTH=699 /DNA_ID=CAMNT_0048138889 /DNA_START=103 /DNA_END=2202 /DNA_ORIENTATION=+